ncbi:MAG TPA: cytochrome b/b6 domain-containing protein [Ideonella sp.]|uniref:cytochrome b/b6 domain-containing protein n=1 Tax=Ideonella sp. TaxID=1929293 RepID=UPI002E34FF5F|nr:cytochrome b/b6 domain-containing protein [Ideonella sp.]HEX5683972.1 cytochrome b/b6 domain-containing protein [Ideonella sp.]
MWDLPTRVFHWTLASCVVGAIVTAQIGGHWIDWHLRLGVATLALLAFRLVWGLVGPRYARFSALLLKPSTVVADFRGRSATRHVGHSPSGSLAVVCMLGVLAIQATAGLFSSDSISTEGPLAHLVGEASIEWATWLHLKLQWVIYVVIGLHLLAIVAYLVIKKENLVTPMLGGFKADLRAPHAADSWATRLAGLLLLTAFGAAAFWWLR